MLVMSLSPLLGQAIPDIAKTTEINVFLRYLWFQSVKTLKGKTTRCTAKDSPACSDVSIMPKPQAEKQLAVPAEDFLEGPGWCSRVPLGTLGQHFWVHCVAFCSCLRPNPQFFRKLLPFCLPCKRFACNRCAFSSNFG